MLKYNEIEAITSTYAVRNFSSLLSDLDKNKKNKLFIIKNGKPQAIMLSVKEYEKNKKIALLLKELYSMLKR